MLQNWEDEKARILQDELGVTDDEISRLAGSSNGLGQSTLGRSTLGASTRRVSWNRALHGKQTAHVTVPHGPINQ